MTREEARGYIEELIWKFGLVTEKFEEELKRSDNDMPTELAYEAIWETLSTMRRELIDEVQRMNKLIARYEDAER